MLRKTFAHSSPALAATLLALVLTLSGCASSGTGGTAADQRALADFIHSSTAASTVARGSINSPVDVSPDEFGSTVLGAQIPVLVEFWAPWCQPCRRMLPALEQVAREYSGRVRVARVNIDEAPRWARRYRVDEIPALLLFNDGRLLQRRVGALPASDLRMYVADSMAAQAGDPSVSATAGLR